MPSFASTADGVRRSRRVVSTRLLVGGLLSLCVLISALAADPAASARPSKRRSTSASTAARSGVDTIWINEGTPDNPKGKRITKWGYDLNSMAHVKGLMAPLPKDGVGLAEELYDDDVGLGMDVLRMPIFASIHEEEGYGSVSSDPKNAYDHYYAAIIQAARRAMEAKEPGDLVVFASLKVLKPWGGKGVPRPTGYKDRSLPGWAATLTEYVDERVPEDDLPEECEPGHIGVDPNYETCHLEQRVRPLMYAKLLRDYLTYMEARGIHIDVLGVDNEPEENEAGISALRHHDPKTKSDDVNVYASVVRALKNDCGVSECPEFIGPEALGPESTDAMFPRASDWLAMTRKKHRDLIDYAGTHYYTKWRSLAYAAKLWNFAAQAGSIELWDTEFHWTTRKTGGVIKESVHSLMGAFDHFEDFGFKGMVWWDLDVRWRSIRSKLQHQLVQTTSDTWPINAWDPDGVLMESGKLNVRAFKTNSGEVIVWILNDSMEGRTTRIRIGDTKAERTDLRVVGNRWTSSGSAPVSRRLTETLRIPKRSITVVRLSGVYATPR